MLSGWFKSTLRWHVITHGVYNKHFAKSNIAIKHPKQWVPLISLFYLHLVISVFRLVENEQVFCQEMRLCTVPLMRTSTYKKLWWSGIYNRPPNIQGNNSLVFFLEKRSGPFTTDGFTVNSMRLTTRINPLPGVIIKTNTGTWLINFTSWVQNITTHNSTGTKPIKSCLDIVISLYVWQ